MSLSRWFRDYVYIPLGGNRGSAAHDLPQPHHRLPARRALARRRLDLHRLGALPRPAARRPSGPPGSRGMPADRLQALRRALTLPARDDRLGARSGRDRPRSGRRHPRRDVRLRRLAASRRPSTRRPPIERPSAMALAALVVLLPAASSPDASSTSTRRRIAAGARLAVVERRRPGRRRASSPRLVQPLPLLPVLMKRRIKPVPLAIALLAVAFFFAPAAAFLRRQRAKPIEKPTAGRVSGPGGRVRGVRRPHGVERGSPHASRGGCEVPWQREQGRFWRVAR